MSRGYSLLAVHGFLIVAASLGADHGLSSCSFWVLEFGLVSCGPRASLLLSIWGLPGPGIEHVSSAWAGEFLSTGPLGKLMFLFLYSYVPLVSL